MKNYTYTIWHLKQSNTKVNIGSSRAFHMERQTDYYNIWDVQVQTPFQKHDWMFILENPTISPNMNMYY